MLLLPLADCVTLFARLTCFSASCWSDVPGRGGNLADLGHRLRVTEGLAEELSDDDGVDAGRALSDSDEPIPSVAGLHRWAASWVVQTICLYSLDIFGFLIGCSYVNLLPTNRNKQSVSCFD